MRSITTDRDLPDGTTANGYLEDALDREWRLNIEYLGNRADMRLAWGLQNELRLLNGLRMLGQTDLDDAVSHMEVEG